MTCMPNALYLNEFVPKLLGYFSADLPRQFLDPVDGDQRRIVVKTQFGYAVVRLIGYMDFVKSFFALKLLNQAIHARVLFVRYFRKKNRYFNLILLHIL